jgi:hypothetical protein
MASCPLWATPRAFSVIRAGLAVAATAVISTPSDAWPEVVWRTDFSDFRGGSIETWLQAKGFRLEHGAEDPDLLALSVREGALLVEAKAPVKGFLVNRDISLEKVSKVRIHWGILDYPEHASYARGVHNEALMLYIFFGREKFSSGHVLIPALPYFIGLFLGQEESLNIPYQGRYFQKGGRFVCVGNPKPQETVLSEFELTTAFRTYFRKAEVPEISGITLGVDTFRSGDGGKAAAYIYSIEFLD